MVKHHTVQSLLNFTWEQVARGFWNRYPNPHSNHVLSEDVICRQVVDGKLFTKKLITKTNKIPKWGEKFVSRSSKYVHMIEESIVDPLRKTFVTYTRNVGMMSILTVGEKSVYSVDPTNALATTCVRTAWAESQLRLYGVARPIEAFVIERFKKNVKSTQKGLEYVLEKTFPSTQELPSSVPKMQLKEKAKKAKEMATRAGQKVVTTYTGQTAA